MAKLKVDLRFVEAPYEVMMVGEYIALIEAHFDAVIEAETNRLKRQREVESDEAERSVASHLLFQLEDGVTTRFLAASGATAVWGVFEASVERFATYLAKERGVSLRIDDLRGDFLHRAGKYFSDVLDIPLCPDKDDWRALTEIVLVRNSLAHATGKLSDLRARQARLVRSLAKRDKQIRIVDEYLIVPVTWIRRAHGVVERVLGDLKVRVEGADAPQPIDR